MGKGCCKSRDTEGKLYDAAIKMIVTHGYKGATTKLIASEAGVTEVTLFRKFGTKENLIKSAIRRNSEWLSKSSISYTGELRKDLHKITSLYLVSVQQRGDFMFTMLSELSRNPNLREVMELPFQKILSTTQIIQRYQLEGSLRGRSPINTLFSLLGPIMMSHAASRLLPEQSIEWDVDSLVDDFLKGHLQERKQNQNKK